MLVVDDHARLASTPGKACAVFASLRILEAGFAALEDGIDTVQGLPNQVFEVFVAFDKVAK